MIKSKKFKTGFLLIEFIIVLIILGIFLPSLYWGYLFWQKKFNAEQKNYIYNTEYQYMEQRLRSELLKAISIKAENEKINFKTFDGLNITYQKSQNRLKRIQGNSVQYLNDQVKISSFQTQSKANLLIINLTLEHLKGQTKKLIIYLPNL